MQETMVKILVAVVAVQVVHYAVEDVAFVVLTFERALEGAVPEAELVLLVDVVDELALPLLVHSL